jgi:hypothetical protein
MAHSHIVLPIKPPTTPSSIAAKPDQEWGRLMRETVASTGVPQADAGAASVKNERFDLDGQVQNLQREINRTINEYRSLSQAAGDVHSHQQNQIGMLMTMIASLGRKISIGGNLESRESQQIYGLMTSMQSELEAQRARNRSEGATASLILGQMQGMQGNLERALAQILQQLSALHMRMSSLL